MVLPSWKLWQKALLIILCIPIIIVIYYIIFPPSISFKEEDLILWTN